MTTLARAIFNYGFDYSLRQIGYRIDDSLSNNQLYQTVRDTYAVFDRFATSKLPDGSYRFLKGTVQKTVLETVTQICLDVL